MSFEGWLNDVVLVLVLYKSKLQNSSSFQSLIQKQHPKPTVLVFDNSADQDNQANILYHTWLHYFHYPENIGLSSAYNKAFEWAKSHKKKYLLLLDQDSTFPKESLETYFEAITNAIDIPLVAPLVKSGNHILSPCHYFLKRGWHKRQVAFGKQSLRKTGIINSGMLIQIEAFEKVGGYDERIHLDFSDHHFVEKIKQHYPYFVLIPSTVIQNFDDHQTKTLKATQKRFVFFIKGAKYHANNFGEKCILGFWVLSRALRLTIKYKTFNFFLLFIRYFLR